MRVVVVGDLAWKGRYHLGDEAMSEVALNELQARGAEITFIAGNPEVTSEFYGVDAVARFGFGSIRTREDKDQFIDALVASVSDGADAPGSTETTISAIRHADAVVIAGGGNLNSIGLHHVYERLAVKRVAEQLGVPLYVTSQTVGPHLREEEREIVAEIASYATVFGARERNTAALMRALCGDTARIVHTLDDAILLRPAETGSPIELPEKYIVASFTYHASTTGLHKEEYYRELSSMLDSAAEKFECDVLLLPHMSTFEEPNTLGKQDDKYGHDRIALYSRSGRVKSMPLMSARELLAVTAGASFTMSTRYHPLIFGAALGVPAMSLVTSYYSAIRMRGALDNVGMENFTLPFEYWTPAFGAPFLDAMAERLEEYTEHIRRVGAQQRSYQESWWDGIYASMTGTGDVHLEDREQVAAVDWCSPHELEQLMMARVAQESLNLEKLNRQLKDADTKLSDWEDEQRTKELERAVRKLQKSTRELEKRLEHEAGQLRHEMRPPGAALRDNLRLKLRNRLRK